jgi:hypothetical protein
MVVGTLTRALIKQRKIFAEILRKQRVITKKIASGTTTKPYKIEPLKTLAQAQRLGYKRLSDVKYNAFGIGIPKGYRKRNSMVVKKLKKVRKK